MGVEELAAASQPSLQPAPKPYSDQWTTVRAIPYRNAKKRSEIVAASADADPYVFDYETLAERAAKGDFRKLTVYDNHNYKNGSIGVVTDAGFDSDSGTVTVTMLIGGSERADAVIDNLKSGAYRECSLAHYAVDGKFAEISLCKRHSCIALFFISFTHSHAGRKGKREGTTAEIVAASADQQQQSDIIEITDFGSSTSPPEEVKQQISSSTTTTAMSVPVPQPQSQQTIPQVQQPAPPLAAPQPQQFLQVPVDAKQQDDIAQFLEFQRFKQLSASQQQQQQQPQVPPQVATQQQQQQQVDPSATAGGGTKKRTAYELASELMQQREKVAKMEGQWEMVQRQIAQQQQQPAPQVQPPPPPVAAAPQQQQQQAQAAPQAAAPQQQQVAPSSSSSEFAQHMEQMKMMAEHYGPNGPEPDELKYKQFLSVYEGMLQTRRQEVARTRGVLEKWVNERAAPQFLKDEAKRCLDADDLDEFYRRYQPYLERAEEEARQNQQKRLAGFGGGFANVAQQLKNPMQSMMPTPREGLVQGSADVNFGAQSAVDVANGIQWKALPKISLSTYTPPTLTPDDVSQVMASDRLKEQARHSYMAPVDRRY